MHDNNSDKKNNVIVSNAMQLFNYLDNGIWSDPRRKWWLNILRTINLSVKSFLNRDIQTQACGMTYRTMLAIVPALALLIAIGRGFGIQNVLQQELYELFPAQRTAIEYAMNFVDAYMAQTSDGIFLGIGIVFLLWSLISLLSNVESTFNYIWGQRNGRSFWRKISDYTAMLFILPVLMLCSSGLSILLNSSLRHFFDFNFLTPVISIFLEGAKWVMTCLFFAAVYLLIPYTKVKLGNALISGTIAGTGFGILQWLFLTGTLYVTKYNAIYGSLAVLPLLMLWLQLVWVVTLAGAVICYSSQNVFAFRLDREVSSISTRYNDMVTVAITAVIARRFVEHKPPVTAGDLMNLYELPARLVTNITDRLCAAGVTSRVIINDDEEVHGLQLAVAPEQLTVATLRTMLRTLGAEHFINDFERNFPNIQATIAQIDNAASAAADNVPVHTLVNESNLTTSTKL